MIMLFFGISLTINIVLVLGIILYFKIKSKANKVMGESFENMLESMLTTDVEDVFGDAVVEKEQAEETWL